MAEIGNVTGMEQVLANLKRQKKRFALKVNEGLKLAGLYLQGKSQKLVPVEYGPLKASAFTRATGKGFQTKVNVGYTAAYAIYVHEAVGMKLKGQPRVSGKGLYWDPQGQAQAKFLEAPFREHRNTLINIVRNHVRLK